MKEYSSDLYEEIAGIYDASGISTFSLSFGKAILKYWKEQKKGKPIRKSLDLCCGTGELVRYLRECGIASRGVDYSPEMLEMARKKDPEGDYLQADATEYEDGETYDLITCCDDALNHITDPKKVDRTFFHVSRMLDSEGLFCFDLDIYSKLPYEKEYVQSVLSNDSGRDTKLIYRISHEDGLEVTHIKLVEDGVKLWERNAVERDYSMEQIADLLNRNHLEILCCAQNFHDQKSHAKWKIVAGRCAE